MQKRAFEDGGHQGVLNQLGSVRERGLPLPLSCCHQHSAGKSLPSQHPDLRPHLQDGLSRCVWSRSELRVMHLKIDPLEALQA